MDSEHLLAGSLDKEPTEVEGTEVRPVAGLRRFSGELLPVSIKDEFCVGMDRCDSLR